MIVVHALSTAFWMSYVALCALTAFQTFVLIGLVRAYHRRPEAPAMLPFGLPRGNPVPPFSAVDTEGRVFNSQSLAGEEHALLFVSSRCSTCSVTLMELDALKAKTRGNVVVVCRDSLEECRELAGRYSVSVPVIVDHDLELSEALQVDSTPTAVMIDAQGLVLTYGNPMSADDVERLMMGAAHSNGDSHPPTLALSEHGPGE